MTETARHAILHSLRGKLWQAAELPSLQRSWLTFDDPRQQFSEVLRGVGGQAIRLSDENDLAVELEKLSAFQTARKIAATVADVPRANVDLHAIDDAHRLADVDLFIARGKFAVAENAAVWVTDEGLPHRVLFFLTQHLILVVPSSNVINNMHEAYERLNFSEPHFGVFISGPSKTADIEQSLVIGAHGARSLTVFLVDAPAASD